MDDFWEQFVYVLILSLLEILILEHASYLMGQSLAIDPTQSDLQLS